jgi:hypothetical protein
MDINLFILMHNQLTFQSDHLSSVSQFINLFLQINQDIKNFQINQDIKDQIFKEN